jgi:voltage-gated potassium channel
VARRRLAYLRANWLDVVIVLVPFLRPFRLLRLLRLLPMLVRVVRGLRLILGPYRGSYVLLISLLAVVVSAGMVTVFERDGGGSIDEFTDGLWWAITTITTVGYGDFTPVTAEGRAVAVFLMLIGITLFGVLTASIAAYFVDTSGGDEPEVTLGMLAEKVDALESLIREQRDMLTELTRRARE